MSNFDKYLELTSQLNEFNQALEQKQNIINTKKSNHNIKSVLYIALPFSIFSIFCFFNLYDILMKYNVPELLALDFYDQIRTKDLMTIFKIADKNDYFILFFYLPAFFFVALFNYISLRCLHVLSDLSHLPFKKSLKKLTDENPLCGIIAFSSLILFFCSFTVFELFYPILLVLTIIASIYSGFCCLKFIKEIYDLKNYENNKHSNKEYSLSELEKNVELLNSELLSLKNKIINNEDDMRYIAIESTKLADNKNQDEIHKINTSIDIVKYFEDINENKMKLNEINNKINKVFQRKTQLVND